MVQASNSYAVARQVEALIAADPNAALLLSPDLKIVSVSDSYLGLLDVARGDLVGRHIRDALAGSDSLTALLASAEYALRSGKPHKMMAGLFKAATDGARHQRLLELTHSPVLDEGKAIWVIQSAHEPARPGEERSPDLLALETALQAAEARLRSVLRTVPDAMIIIDERGRIESLSATAERLFGYTADEVTGKNIKLFMPSPHREQHDSYLERYVATGERHIIGVGRIVVGQRKDGTTFPLHLTIGEMRSADKHYFTGFIRDLTDQQMTESRLKELQSEVTHMSRFTALGEMASTLAHEIN